RVLIVATGLPDHVATIDTPGRRKLCEVPTQIKVPMVGSVGELAGQLPYCVRRASLIAGLRITWIGLTVCHAEQRDIRSPLRRVGNDTPIEKRTQRRGSWRGQTAGQHDW